MKFVTFNTNSVRARLPIIEEWLAREQPDVLCVQETKVQDQDFPAGVFNGAGYDVVFKGQKSYNGVAIVSRKRAKDVRSSLSGDEKEEARFISAEIDEISIINVYVPQGVAPGTEKFAYKLNWLKDLLLHLESRYDPGQSLLVAGDFNVALESKDVYDPEGLKGQVGFHPDEKALMQKLLDWGLVDILRKHHPEGEQFTFWDYRIPNALKRKMGWRIDYVLATRVVAETSKDCWIDFGARKLAKPSDHTFLVAEFQI